MKHDSSIFCLALFLLMDAGKDALKRERMYLSGWLKNGDFDVTSKHDMKKSCYLSQKMIQICRYNVLLFQNVIVLQVVGTG